MKTKEFNKIVKECTTYKIFAEVFEMQAIMLYDVIETDDSKHDITIAAKNLIILSSLIAKSICDDVDLLKEAGNVLVEKAKEYAMEGDRLWNFKCNYKFMGDNSLLTLFGYMTKHLASCMDILTGRIKPTRRLIVEKFGDVVNYCILLIALAEGKDKE